MAKDRTDIKLHFGRYDGSPLTRIYDCARAYDLDAPSDGSSKDLYLPDGALQWSAFRLKSWIVAELLELAPPE